MPLDAAPSPSGLVRLAGRAHKGRGGASPSPGLHEGEKPRRQCESATLQGAKTRSGGIFVCRSPMPSGILHGN